MIRSAAPTWKRNELTSTRPHPPTRTEHGMDSHTRPTAPVHDRCDQTRERNSRPRPRVTVLHAGILPGAAPADPHWPVPKLRTPRFLRYRVNRPWATRTPTSHRLKQIPRIRIPMKISRRFTRSGENVFDTTDWSKRSSRITNADGSLVFEMTDAEIPADWSQLATDIVVSKYFRKAGIPQRARKDDGSYDLEGEFIRDESGEVATGPESSVRQIVHRLAGCWRDRGQHGYFSPEEDGQAFYDELSFMLVHQMAPRTARSGSTPACRGVRHHGLPRGIGSPITTGNLTLAPDAYTHPQPHACFIQSVSDNLVSEGGIMDLWIREARLFKYGSGTGTNFEPSRRTNLSRWSKLRPDELPEDRRPCRGRDRPEAPPAGLEDLCLDVDHPDIESFINWKVREEIKVAALAHEAPRRGPEGLRREPRAPVDYDFNGEAYYTAAARINTPSAFPTSSSRRSRTTLNGCSAGPANPRRPSPRRTSGDRSHSPALRGPGHPVRLHDQRLAHLPEGGRINASNPVPSTCSSTTRHATSPTST